MRIIILLFMHLGLNAPILHAQETPQQPSENSAIEKHQLILENYNEDFPAIFEKTADWKTILYTEMSVQEATNCLKNQFQLRQEILTYSHSKLAGLIKKEKIIIAYRDDKYLLYHIAKVADNLSAIMVDNGFMRIYEDDKLVSPSFSKIYTCVKESDDSYYMLKNSDLFRYKEDVKYYKNTKVYFRYKMDYYKAMECIRSKFAFRLITTTRRDSRLFHSQYPSGGHLMYIEKIGDYVDVYFRLPGMRLFRSGLNKDGRADMEACFPGYEQYLR